MLAALGLFLACSGVVEEPAGPSIDLRDRSYLLSPLAGHSRGLSLADEQALQAGFRDLVDRGDVRAARRQAEELLAVNPDLMAARVLAAQADFAERFYDVAQDRLQPVVAEMPDYTAAQLLLGRLNENLGVLPAAVEAYRAAGQTSPLAAERAASLLPRSLEILGNRLDEALARGQREAAQEILDRLLDWAPEAPATVEAVRQVAAAFDDGSLELASLRRMAARQPGDRETLIRLATLELDVGDAGAGLRIFQDLAADNPDDAELAELLSRAKFRWRLVLLPAEVLEVAERPELTRADFAALLYWLFPDIRYRRVSDPRIANDVFNHPLRDEIVRVVNLGIMDVDPDLHVFGPELPIRRGDALASLLRLLSAHQPRPACLGPGSDPGSRIGRASACRKATACRLIATPADCLAESPVSGATALELGRKTQEQLGVD